MFSGIPYAAVHERLFTYAFSVPPHTTLPRWGLFYDHHEYANGPSFPSLTYF